MRKLLVLIGSLYVLSTLMLSAQTVNLQGYVFEENNRGYLKNVDITVYEETRNAVLGKTSTDANGLFIVELPLDKAYRITAEKDLYIKLETNISTIGRKAGEKLFAKMEMLRKPGYIFDVTMAPKRDNESIVVDAIQGARIEVFNNTKEEEVLVLESHPYPTFKCTFEEGNHYTVMIRKEGFFTKRMEAYVNVEGCILCFEGVGEVQPGVSDVLTEGHAMGTLLANVELDPVELNKAIKLENIYYGYNSAKITPKASKELDKLVRVLKDNPRLLVELGSHTDSRGKDAYNLKLSKMRAASAVEYITTKGGVPESQIQSKGYGETKLVNSCKNGVKCSEARHQRNRRTELKVVGLSETDPYQNKSLAEILEGEKFERMLAEIQNEEQIRVGEGEELPEEIKRQQEAAEKEPTATEKMKTKEKEKPLSAGKVEVISMPPNKAPEEPKKEESRPSAKPINTTKPKEETAVVEQPSTNIEETIAEEGFEESSEEFGSDVEEEIHDESLIAKEREIEVDVNATLKGPNLLPEGYSGYKVEFYSSPYELPISHQIFSRHGDITMEELKDGSFAYLLGQFEDWRDANKFLNSIMLSRYPDARVIHYKKGRRLNP